MGDAEIADIGEIQPFDLGPGGRMVAVDQHAARLADRGRAEPRARPVGGAEIKRDAGDADRRIGIAVLKAKKARPCGKSGNVRHDLLSGWATTPEKPSPPQPEHASVGD